MRSLRFSLAFVLLAALPATAHDFWIEPSMFRPVPGTVVKVGLRVGEKFVGEPVKRNDAKIERFVVVGPGAVEKTVLGPDGADPAGFFRADEPGVHVIGYRSKHSSVALDAAKFESYLKEEGLEKIVMRRAVTGQSAAPGLEVYSRCAKAILQTKAGEGSSAGFDHVLGFTLEIVPEANPMSLEFGARLPVRVLFEGKPLEGALVVAISQKHPDGLGGSDRTDADGRAAVQLASDGSWLVKCVHMVPAAGRDDADWESFWASLTFETRPAPRK